MSGAVVCGGDGGVEGGVAGRDYAAREGGGGRRGGGLEDLGRGRLVGWWCRWGGERLFRLLLLAGGEGFGVFAVGGGGASFGVIGGGGHDHYGT